jgi:hypothetical protein
MKKGLVLVLCMSAAASASTKTKLSRDGHAGGNGGDPMSLRETIIRDYVGSELKSKLKDYIAHARIPDLISGFDEHETRRVTRQKLIDDVDRSIYVMRDSCKDKNGMEKGATALPLDGGGEVCFNPALLAREAATEAELVGLGFHEHMHHFGYVDADNRIYKVVFQDFAKKSRANGRTPKTLSDDSGVVVPVPSGFGNYGTLLVRGKPGAGQESKVVHIIPVVMDEEGRPRNVSKKTGIRNYETSLEKPVLLPEGAYFLEYSNTIYDGLVHVRVDEQVTVSVRQIRVPKKNGQINFQVFRDVGNQVERDKLAAQLWLDDQANSHLLGLGDFDGPVTWDSGSCEAYVLNPAKAKPGVKEFCASWLASDYHALVDQAFTVESDRRIAVRRIAETCEYDGNFSMNCQGDYQILSRAGPANETVRTTDAMRRALIHDRLYVTDPKDGDFVSVFPGVYGLSFKTNDGAESAPVYGVVVR